jgi:hypothetical protein
MVYLVDEGTGLVHGCSSMLLPVGVTTQNVSVKVISLLTDAVGPVKWFVKLGTDQEFCTTLEQEVEVVSSSVSVPLRRRRLAPKASGINGTLDISLFPSRICRDAAKIPVDVLVTTNGMLDVAVDLLANGNQWKGGGRMSVDSLEETTISVDVFIFGCLEKNALLERHVYLLPHKKYYPHHYLTAYADVIAENCFGCAINISSLDCEIDDTDETADAVVHVHTDEVRNLAVYIVDSEGTIFGGTSQQVPEGLSWPTVVVTITSSLDDAVGDLYWLVRLEDTDTLNVCASVRKKIIVTSGFGLSPSPLVECSINTTELTCVLSDTAESIDAMIHVVSDQPRTLTVDIVAADDTLYGSSSRAVAEGMSWLNIPVTLLLPLVDVDVLFWQIDLKDLGSKESCAAETKELRIESGFAPSPTPEFTECVLNISQLACNISSDTDTVDAIIHAEAPEPAAVAAYLVRQCGNSVWRQP